MRAEAVRLRTVDKKTTPEICKLLNLPNSTVCRWLKGMLIPKPQSALEAGHRICIYCKLDKPNSEFNTKSKTDLSPQPYCRQCQKEKYALYYTGDNRTNAIAKQKLRNVKYIEANKIKLLEYLQTHPCSCGEADPILLEFDHRDPSTKKETVSSMIFRFTWKSIEEEIAKCDVLCVKCHRKKTAKDFNWFKHLNKDVG